MEYMEEQMDNLIESGIQEQEMLYKQLQNLEEKADAWLAIGVFNGDQGFQDMLMKIEDIKEKLGLTEMDTDDQL